MDPKEYQQGVMHKIDRYLAAPAEKIESDLRKELFRSEPAPSGASRAAATTSS